MTEFKQYRRSQIAELRPWMPGDDMTNISVSAPDREAGSPKAGDMIARNPKNHADQWLVAAQYFADNFEEAGPQVEPFGYLLERAGIDNGYNFFLPREVATEEERFKHIFTPVYRSPPQGVPVEPTREMIDAACKARHGARAWNAAVRNDTMHAWVTSHRGHMRDILTAAARQTPEST